MELYLLQSVLTGVIGAGEVWGLVVAYYFAKVAVHQTFWLFLYSDCPTDQVVKIIAFFDLLLWEVSSLQLNFSLLRLTKQSLWLGRPFPWISQSSIQKCKHVRTSHHLPILFILLFDDWSIPFGCEMRLLIHKVFAIFLYERFTEGGRHELVKNRLTIVLSLVFQFIIG